MSLYFCPFSIKKSKCSDSCNTINDPDAVKNLNVKGFNLMSRTNETRYITWHEMGKCKCGLDASVCNNKQRSNDDKCRCECKELVDKGVCDKGYIWNPSNCECECDKSSDVGEYLDYENCKCRKILIDKLLEQCNEIFEEVEIIGKINAIFVYCTLYYFQYSLQLMLELLLILLTINT